MTAKTGASPAPECASCASLTSRLAAAEHLAGNRGHEITALLDQLAAARDVIAAAEQAHAHAVAALRAELTRVLSTSPETLGDAPSDEKGAS